MRGFSIFLFRGLCLALAVSAPLQANATAPLQQDQLALIHQQEAALEQQLEKLMAMQGHGGNAAAINLQIASIQKQISQLHMQERQLIGFPQKYEPPVNKPAPPPHPHEQFPGPAPAGPPQPHAATPQPNSPGSNAGKPTQHAENAPHELTHGAALASDVNGSWYDQLQSGLLQYSVPKDMKWKESSTVTVVVDGEKVKDPQAIDDQTGQHVVQVSRHMRVLVSAPLDPDEFDIQPESDTTEIQPVSEDHQTVWRYRVTPKYSGKSQQIVVEAWAINDKGDQQQFLPVFSAPVHVHVPGFWEILKRLFEGNPEYWLNYGLPGGAGFIFVSGAIAATWKFFRRKPA